MDKLLYGDFEEQYTDYETAEIAILPVPYDGTSTWLKGADKGPRAILEASPNMEFYDIETDSEVYKHGIATLEPVTADSSPQAMAQEVEQRVEAILKDKKFPVLLGGEHSVSIGAFKAIAKYYDTWGNFFAPGHNTGMIVRRTFVFVAAPSKKSTISIRTVFFMPMKLKNRTILPGCTKCLKNSTIMCMSQSTWTYSTPLICRRQVPPNPTD